MPVAGFDQAERDCLKLRRLKVFNFSARYCRLQPQRLIRLINEQTSTSMKQNDDIKQGTAHDQKNKQNQRTKEASDFVVGMVTFLLFLVFMTAWMYFTA